MRSRARIALAAALSLSFAAEAGAIEADLRLAAVMAAPMATAGAAKLAARRSACELIEAQSRAHGLPAMFLARLIWQESRFNPRAVSPKGAEGIAQFMPTTAAERGLADPFDVKQAIPHSARYLKDLYDRFGSIGLAAAAYNAGPERISGWLADHRALPAETRHYVHAITGIPAEDWKTDDGAHPVVQPAAVTSFVSDCLDLTRAAPMRSAKARPGKGKTLAARRGKFAPLAPCPSGRLCRVSM